MRPDCAPLHARIQDDLRAASLRAVASAAFVPRGPGYAPALRLRRRVIALRGGPDAIVLGFSWVGGAVRMRVLAAGECSSADVEEAIAAGRRVSAVDDDPTPFLKLVSEHPLLGPLSRRNDARIDTTPTVFETFAVAVIEQLVTGVEARASIRRLWRIAGEAVLSTRLVAAPTAAAVKRVPMWKMHELGIGARRAVTLHNGAGRGAALERLRGVDPASALERMQSLPGVGPWTANAVARRGLGWADAVPVGDFHLPFTITEALGGPSLRREQAKEADEHMLALLEPFRPHRARVALLLERHSMSNRRYRLPKIDPHRREPWKY
jgi:3-methyladenine DNA glycosylase/8-oxoguanine DNA glycosylase